MISSFYTRLEECTSAAEFMLRLRLYLKDRVYQITKDGDRNKQKGFTEDSNIILVKLNILTSVLPFPTVTLYTQHVCTGSVHRGASHSQVLPLTCTLPIVFSLGGFTPLNGAVHILSRL